LFLHEDIYDKFIEKFKEKAASMKVTDGFDPTCELGPLVDKLQFDRVMGFIETGKKEGATVETGGTQVGTEGYFVSPTLFTGLNDNMTVAREEIFGPVVCALKFKTEEEVILRANDTPYGLGAAVHTKDIRLAARMVNAIESGTVWVNCYNVFMDQLPFGGYKQSGIGREMGEYALREYTQIKTVISSIIDGV